MARPVLMQVVALLRGEEVEHKTMDFTAMADGSGPPRRRGKRRSHIGDQIGWVMRQEVEAGLIKPDGFVLLEKDDLVSRVKARLTGAGIPEGGQPDDEQIRRWQVQKLKAMGL
jgi:hypothetical protein